MPPKKAEKPGDTRDAGTDPPPPLEYDPFDLDGRAMLEDFQTIPQKVQEAVNALRKQHTTGAPKTIKDEVIQTLEIALQWMANFTGTLNKARTISHRLQCIEREVLGVKAELRNLPAAQQPPNSLGKDLKEIKAAIQPVKSWIEVARTAPPSTKTQTKHDIHSLKRQNRETLRQERAKYELTLTTNTASPEIQQRIKNMHAKDITERCRNAINESSLNKKPQINGINKLTSGNIRLQCQSEDEVKQLRDIDWNKAFEGIKVHKPKYGIVIHGVPKTEIDLTRDHADIISKLEKGNTHICDIDIVKIAPLYRKSTIKESLHQSIVVFTENAQAADRCIHNGIYIDYLLYRAERYAPQLNITQCYKCWDYGHLAVHCKRKEKCRKCGDEKHTTADCSATEPKCLHCEDKHEAWDHDCPERIRECLRMGELKKQTSRYYTT